MMDLPLLRRSLWLADSMSSLRVYHLSLPGVRRDKENLAVIEQMDGQGTG